MSDIIRLNGYISNGCKVVSLISAGMLSDFPGDSSLKNHWIVWDSQVKCNDGLLISASTSALDKVDLTLFSWGKVKSQLKNDVSLDVFMKHTFGGLVFRPIK